MAFQQELWKENSKILVGVSGGPDSVCLLDILARLAPKYKLKLHLAHVNYGLRGKDNDKDEGFVKKLAAKYDLRIDIKKSRVKARHGNSEAALREVRYDFFETLRKKNKFDFIAVAHNADDQVETFLMRIIRGSGVQGLASMKYKNEKVIRPLLGITKEEILDYLKSNGLRYRLDKTNRENLFFRNKIRNRLIPYLERNFNPNIKKTISNSLIGISHDYSFIFEQAGKVSSDTKELSVKKTLKLHPSLQRNVIRRFLRQQNPDLVDVESAHVEEIVKIFKSRKNKIQTMKAGGLKLTRKGDKVTISYN